jgi:transketolase
METRARQGLGFHAETLPPEAIEDIKARAHRARGDILTMTTLANSGHPGGSMSSIDFYMTLWSCANVDPADPHRPDRDRIVVSHGHTSPGVYSALAHTGFVDAAEAICGFRQAWSRFEGHIEREVPGVEWSTGNLGQGLSAGCGMALASRLTGHGFRVWVCMGDGEQQKGQLSEARRFAAKFKLVNLAAVIDYNQLQLSGSLEGIMPQNIKAEWEADGWKVVVVDGHDIEQLYGAMHRATQAVDHPVCIIANTVMGKGVPFIENQFKYHGAALSPQQYKDAMAVLGLPDMLDHYKALRPEIKARATHGEVPNPPLRIDTGTPRTYAPDVKTDNRSAWGAALEDIGRLNLDNPDTAPIAVFDCDLIESVKTGGFAHACPDQFFQGGIQEHNTATMAGALSTQGVLTFWSDFGAFGVDEVYNQQRLNDINRIILPADPNETDRAIRYVAGRPGNFLVAMGRSKLPVITREDGQPAFAGDFTFEYGRAVVLREGTDLAILSTGTMTHRAVQAWDLLKAEGISARVVHISAPLAIDLQALRAAADLGLIFTYEDHHAGSGLGGLTAEALIDLGLCPTLVRMGVTKYQPSGQAEDVFAAAGLDTKSLVKRVKEAVEKRRSR